MYGRGPIAVDLRIVTMQGGGGGRASGSWRAGNTDILGQMIGYEQEEFRE